MPKQFTPETRAKAQAAIKANKAKHATQQPLTKKNARLSLADYLNHPKPPMITRDEAIRLRCLDCCGNSHKEVELCPAAKCPLWPYRQGAYQFPVRSYWETHRVWDYRWDDPAIVGEEEAAKNLAPVFESEPAKSDLPVPAA
jgi:hypothetical protein